ncbi:MAG: glycosyltransferase family 2 protein [Planctomycetota bacterium]
MADTLHPHSISVLITTYRRPGFLRKSIDSLSRQTRRPDQILIVARDGDTETLAEIDSLYERYSGLPIESVNVAVPGVIAANNRGFPLLRGDIVAFQDDDSTASPTWLENLAKHYLDESVGGVGGKIINHSEGQVLYRNQTFGQQCQRIDRWGRIHAGQMYPFEGTWEVESLTGSNMSFRRRLLAACDQTLFGDGFRYELDLCLMVIAAGYRVLLDADAVNEHWCAPRKQGPERKERSVVEAHSRHNQDYVLAKHYRSTLFVLLRRLFVRFPKDVLARLGGAECYPLRYLRFSLTGMIRGLTYGRAERRRQLHELRKPKAANKA